MRILTLSLLLVLLTVSSFAQSWQKGYAFNWQKAFDITQLNDGNLLLTGFADSTSNTHGNLISLDELGNINWSKIYNETGANAELKESVQLVNGNIVSVGYKESPLAPSKDAWILITDVNGNLISASSYGSTGEEELYAIEATNDGGFIVCGTTDEQTSDGSDCLVMKFDSNGGFEWDLIINGNAIEMKEVAYDIIQLQDLSYVCVGNTYSHGNGESDVYQVHIDASGNVTDAFTVGGALDEKGYGILQLDNGNIITVGSTLSFGSVSKDIIVKATDNTGTEVWTRKIVTPAHGTAFDVIEYNGNILITGQDEQSGSGWQPTMLWVEMDYDGNILSNQNISGGMGYDAYKTIVLPGNRIASAGWSDEGENMKPYVVVDDLSSPNCSFGTIALTLDTIHSDSSATDSYTSATGLSSNITVIAEKNLTPNQQVNCFNNPNDACLIASYEFSGNTNDKSGYGQDLNSASTVYGLDRNNMGNASFDFDGLSAAERFNFPNSFTGYTFTSWINADATLNKQGIVSLRGNQSVDVLSAVGLYIENGNLYAMHQTADQTVNILPGGAIDAAKWVHVVSTWDQSTLTLYVNGVYAGDISFADISPLTGDLDIGGLFDSAVQGFESGFVGSIDYVKIYDCALSEAEIDSIYQAEKPEPICTYNITNNQQDVSCFGASDGQVEVIVSGNQGPYSVSWNTGASGDILSNLSAGQYDATITDSVGCTETVNLEVLEPNATEFSLTSTNATCGQGNGDATVGVINADYEPYSFEWSNGDTIGNVDNTSLADSLYAGPTNVIITDGLGCVFSQTVMIGEDGGATVTDVATDISCFGGDDGSINLTVSTSNAPYTVEWTSGATTDDLTNLTAGVYQYIVEDETGCITTGSVQLNQPSEIEFSNSVLTNPTCGLSDGSITVSGAEGTGTGIFTYSWDANAGNQTGTTASNLSAGTYSVDLTDANGCVQTSIFDLSDGNGPTITVQSITAPRCNAGLGAVNIRVNGGTAPYTYDWNTGAITQDIFDLNPGTYNVLATDAGGCSGASHVVVAGIRPKTQEICIVTVDSLTGTNLIAWEKPVPSQGVDHYIIYREGNAAGVFDSIGTVQYDSLSQFTDPIANPLIRAWRYKLTAVDSCGIESQLSAEHKTLHLTVNLGVNNTMNLIWDDYIGFTYPSYYISRYHTSTGWEYIDTISSNLTSYTDVNPPSGGTNLLYSVEAPAPSTCTSTKSQDHNSTRSNRSTLAGPAPDLGINDIHSNLTAVYPNPTNGLVNISLGQIRTEVNISITDINGRILQQSSKNELNFTVDLSSYENGLYIIRLSNDDMIEEIKIVKQ